MATVITGASAGIGAALALRLAAAAGGAPIFLVARRADALEAVRAAAPAGADVRLVTADLADVSSGPAKVAEAVLAAGVTVKYLVHNAGVLGPVAPLATVKPEELRAVLAVNVEAPLRLTQLLLPAMKPGSRVLHISSGAARSAIEGWGCYCVSKAAFAMQYRILAAELKASHGVLVGSVRPGVVDTAMQGLIRASDAAVFPELSRFVGLFEKRRTEEGGAALAAAPPQPPPNGGLDSPANVAHYLAWLLGSTGDEEFSADEWDIRDAKHFHRWTAAPQQ